MTNLHNKIMQQTPVNKKAIDKAIKEACESADNIFERLRLVYEMGYRDARYAASELAKREGK